ncbi:MAG: hypothetical protein ACD_16C00222G0003 [uncultured bacterium]|nr:MAG: hypothetical protein ACD_16C00222G0003 [uncultured bacterium]OFW67943.1 MAG: hypothetical protein A2X70_05965 [Alphaproteobacteria bacterium GWC2_42_16]OFW74710.1 MAG: hypothetical protein A2Z80_00320 [Alphaproteobacteria bacterium GWA2_41_27]OFW84772.1 MAG: hypothetical protein A3E50_00695 [Alphaproteobacteria bacterium RIFCSPHIGHO2_12_FULL_42_100]OFW84926.1 MAG: hypothetical protein A2W06_04085 [Alphaproteobacteria bacterium RBG_16_42_14]OFW90646.1 MAG: hypothetical protein A3C41_045
MNQVNIHNFQHFLKELEKNLSEIDKLLEQETLHLKNIYVLHDVMTKMCNNWSHQLEHRG